MTRLRNYYRQFKYSDIERQSLYMFAVANLLFLLFYQIQINFNVDSSIKAVMFLTLLIPSLIAFSNVRKHPKWQLGLFTIAYMGIMPIVVYLHPSPTTGGLIIALMYIMYFIILIISTRLMVYTTAILLIITFFFVDYHHDRTTNNIIELTKDGGFTYMIFFFVTALLLVLFSALFITNLKAILSRYIGLNKKSRELNRQLIYSNNKLIVQNETITNISIFNSHQLRKEVANLIGLLQLEESLPSSEGELKESQLKMMQKTANQLDHLLKQNEENLSKHI